MKTQEFPGYANTIFQLLICSADLIPCKEEGRGWDSNNRSRDDNCPEVHEKMNVCERSHILDFYRSIQDPFDHSFNAPPAWL